MKNDVDVVFHDILLQKTMRFDGDGMSGFKLRDSIAQAQLVSLYASQAESVRLDLERQARAGEDIVVHIRGKDYYIDEVATPLPLEGQQSEVLFWER